jgi:hypothetical protein
MASNARSTLGAGLGLETLAVAGSAATAFVGHAVLVGVLLLMSALPQCQSTTIDPQDVIQVSLISLPKTDSGMVQMDVQQATAEAPVVEDAPTPQDNPGLADDGLSEPEVLKNPSDLAFETPDATENKGDPDQARNDQSRADTMRRLKREQLLKTMGTSISTAGDPDSQTDDNINMGGSGAISDPVLASYLNKIQKTFEAHFVPLPSVEAANPDIYCRVNVRWEHTSGEVQSYSWVEHSANPSYDASCERAVDAVSRLPLPPATLMEHPAIISGSLNIKFEPKS